jgi:hypothetical protein
MRPRLLDLSAPSLGVCNVKLDADDLSLSFGDLFASTSAT